MENGVVRKQEERYNINIYSRLKNREAKKLKFEWDEEKN